VIFREQRVEIDESIRVEFGQIGRVVAFERVDQKECVRVHSNVRFSPVFGLRLALVDDVCGTRLLSFPQPGV